MKQDFSNDVLKKIKSLSLQPNVVETLKDYLITQTHDQQIAFLDQGKVKIQEELFYFEQNMKAAYQNKQTYTTQQGQKQTLQYKEEEESQDIQHFEEQQADDISLSDYQEEQVTSRQPKSTTDLIQCIKDRIISEEELKIIIESQYNQDVLPFCFIPIVYMQNTENDNQYTLLITNQNKEIVFSIIPQLEEKTLNDDKEVQIVNKEYISDHDISLVLQKLQQQNENLKFYQWQLDVISDIINQKETKSFKHLKDYWDLGRLSTRPKERLLQLIQRQELLSDEITKPIQQREDWFTQFQLFNKREDIEEQINKVKEQLQQMYGKRQDQKTVFLSINQHTQVLSNAKQVLQEFQRQHKTQSETNQPNNQEHQEEIQLPYVGDEIEIQQNTIKYKNITIPITATQYKFVPVNNQMEKQENYNGKASIIKIAQPYTFTKILFAQIQQ